MICQKCKKQGVFVKMAIGSDYWYCRTCKEEIELELTNRSRQANDDEDMDLLAEFERLLTEWDDDGGTPKNSMPPNCSDIYNDLDKWPKSEMGTKYEKDPWFYGGCR